MASKAGANIWQTVRKHIPLIRFPNRLLDAKTAPNDRVVKGETTAATSYGKTADQDQSFLGLPERYRRRPLVAEEMEFIERGGPE